MEERLDKVTIFITTQTVEGRKLLLIKHPNAGIQIPAGTVEEGETWFSAALRETAEETGLESFLSTKLIGFEDTVLPEDKYIVHKKTIVFSRPDPSSFGWAQFRRGIYVNSVRSEENYLQMNYTEYDKVPDSNYVTYRIMGWVPKDKVTKNMRRFYYHFEAAGFSGDAWLHSDSADNHTFKLFWAPLDNLPEIISPQDKWLEYIKNSLNYTL